MFISMWQPMAWIASQMFISMWQPRNCKSSSQTFHSASGEIHLLISHKEGQLAINWSTPQKIRTVGDLVLWDGPLGKTVAGTHPELFEEVTVSAHMSRTHFARSMRTAAVKYEERTCVVPFHPPQNQQAPKAIHGQHSSSTATASNFLEWWK